MGSVAYENGKSPNQIKCLSMSHKFDLRFDFLHVAPAAIETSKHRPNHTLSLEFFFHFLKRKGDEDDPCFVIIRFSTSADKNDKN